jgi:hypothetical protein
MRATPNTPIRVLVLFLFQAFCAGTAQSQTTDNSLFKDELSRQEQIYHGKGEQRLDGYVIDRGLSTYTNALPSGFGSALANLGPNDRWLDIGAGMGQAVLDYYSPIYESKQADGWQHRGKKASTVAMSIEDRRTPYWHEVAARLEANQLQYVFNKPLKEYSSAELGKFQLITDVIGGFSYSTDLSLFIEKVMGFLTVNGTFYTVLQDVRAEAGTNKPYYAGASFLTEIQDARGSEVGICSWLKSMSCVQVTCEAKPDWQPPVEVYRIQKVCNDVVVPTLRPIHFQAGTPPERGFRLASPARPPGAVGASRPLGPSAAPAAAIRPSAGAQ